MKVADQEKINKEEHRNNDGDGDSSKNDKGDEI